MKKSNIVPFLFCSLCALGSEPAFSQQNIAPQNLFVLSPAERVLFTAPYTHTWGNNYEDYPLKAFWDAFNKDTLPVPMVGTGPATWYSHTTQGSQNHALLWIGEGVLAHALAGNANQYDIFAQKAMILLDSLDFVEGHMRHEGIGGYIDFWQGGIAAMALAGLYAPTGSTQGPALLKSARRWWSDHIAVLRTFRMPDGQLGLIGARMNHGLSGEDDAGNISSAVNLQLIDPQPHTTLHPYIAALLTADGQPQHGLGGTYAIHWDNPRHVSVRWIVLRAFQSGAILRVPANHPTPFLKRKVYRWTAGGRIHIGTPAVVGLPRCRFHVSWQSGQYVRIDLADTIGTSGGYAEPNGHLPQSSFIIPSNAVQVLGPVYSTANPACATSGTCTNDASVVSIAKPYRHGCTTIINPQVVIKNEGANAITNLALYYQVDNSTLYSELNKGAIKSKRFSVTSGPGLLPDSTITLTLDASTVSVGTHSLKVWVMDVNKITDMNATNDLDVISFDVVNTGKPTTWVENFENVNPGNIPSDWTLYDADASENWFVYATATNKAAAFNNFAYTGAVNKKDELVMPVIDLTGNTSLYLSFDLAHASKPNATKLDSLEVLISTDCGATFTPIWAKGGTALNTVPDNANLFIPSSANDYKNVTVDVSAYSTSNKAIFKFINWSNNGNSTLIDNIHFTTTPPTSVSVNNGEVSLSVFPVPANDVLHVQVGLPGAEAVRMELVNLLGENILSDELVMNASGKADLKLDVSGLVPGTYFIRLISNESTITKMTTISK